MYLPAAFFRGLFSEFKEFREGKGIIIVGLALRHVKSDYTLERRASAEGFSSYFVMLLSAGEKYLYSGIINYIFHLFLAACGVYRHRSRPVGIGGKVGDKNPGTVGREYTYIVGRHRSKPFEGHGSLVDHFGETAPGNIHPWMSGCILKAQGRTIAIF